MLCQPVMMCSRFATLLTGVSLLAATLVVLVFSVLRGGLISFQGVDLTGPTAPYLAWAVGFLCGFSERFTSDFVVRAESKLGEPVRFDFDRGDVLRPWRIGTVGSDRVELGFTPFHVKRLRVPLLVAGAKLDVVYGHFDGSVVTDDGERLRLRGLPGWAEEMRARW